MRFVFLSLILVLSIVHLYFERKSKVREMRYTKPLLIPFIAIYYVVLADNLNWLVLMALTMSLLGDLFLLNKDKYLIQGIASFLTAHLFYITVFFLSLRDVKYSLWAAVLTIPYVIFCTMIYKLLIRGIRGKNTAFIGYLIVICLMSYCSLCRIIKYSGLEFLMPFVGSLLFILSDTLLAVSILRRTTKSNGVYVMSTYIAAQLLIVSGMML